MANLQEEQDRISAKLEAITGELTEKVPQLEAMIASKQWNPLVKIELERQIKALITRRKELAEKFKRNERQIFEAKKRTRNSKQTRSQKLRRFRR